MSRKRTICGEKNARPAKFDVDFRLPSLGLADFYLRRFHDTVKYADRYWLVVNDDAIRLTSEGRALEVESWKQRRIRALAGG